MEIVLFTLYLCSMSNYHKYCVYILYLVNNHLFIINKFKVNEIPCVRTCSVQQDVWAYCSRPTTSFYPWTRDSHWGWLLEQCEVQIRPDAFFISSNLIQKSINFDQFPRRQTRVPVNLKQTALSTSATPLKSAGSIYPYPR